MTQETTTGLLDVLLPHWTIVCYIKQTYPVMILYIILFVNKVSTFVGYIRSAFANSGLCASFNIFSNIV
jgi:hypothetical protein